MKFRIDRDALLKPLQVVQGVVERRQTLPILSNMLLSLVEDMLSVTGTDMEVELRATTQVGGDSSSGEITVPARQFIDICRSLPSGSTLEFNLEGEKAQIRSGKSRFTLSTLSAADYPSSDDLSDSHAFDVGTRGLRTLLELTHFAMAHQDVRYYLNGLLLEVSSEKLKAIATDGHRLAMAELKVDLGVGEPRQFIVPRKAVLELTRLLAGDEGTVRIDVSGNAIRATFKEVRLTSKLIDGRFPDYQRVIPNVEDCDKQIVISRDLLRQALARASILSNEKYRAIRLGLKNNVLRIVASNPDQEEAEDELEIEYGLAPLDIGFNVSYLMDALGVLPADTARIFLTDSSSSCLIRGEGRDDCQYVVMPMRL
jgi:DNA polymerase-3 subunit beta